MCVAGAGEAPAPAYVPPPAAAQQAYQPPAPQQAAPAPQAAARAPAPAGMLCSDPRSDLFSESQDLISESRSLGTIAQFTLPGSGSAEKIKINAEQSDVRDLCFLASTGY